MNPNHFWRRRAPATRMFRCPERLRESYDAVIIGGAGHGLAAAYCLAREHGISNVAVLEQGDLGGSTFAGSTSIDSSYLTVPAVQLYEQSARLWPDVAHQLDLNLSYARRGHFTLAHDAASLRTLRWRSEINEYCGVHTELVARASIESHLPSLDLEAGGRYPVLGALYQESGAIAEHDAVLWGYARGANQLGVEIHQRTEVIGLDIVDHAVVGVRTTQGRINTRKVLCALAGQAPHVLDMANLQAPLRVHPRQIMICEPMRRWLDPIVASDSLQLQVLQDPRGALVICGGTDPYELQQARATFESAESLATHLLELFPALENINVLRQSAELVDVTSDLAPILGTTTIDGLYLDVGWGTRGFATTPICGKALSHTIATGRNHPLLESFNLSRFARFEPAGEKAT